MDDIKATSSGMLPVLDNRQRGWDAGAAIARIRTFTDSKDAPSAIYKRAFFYYDKDEEDIFGGYKLPFADVVNGELTAIPRGVFYAAGVMAGAMGGVDMPDSDRAAVTRQIDRYYSKMADMWDDDDLESPLKEEPQDQWETRLISFDFVTKAADGMDGGQGIFEGYGSIFGNKDLGNDVVEAGAFAKSLRRRKPKNVKMLWQHKQDEPIGVFQSIKEDGEGLAVTGQLALGTQRGKEAFELMKMGALDGLSIGYKADPELQEWDSRRRRRKLKEIDLMEISLVTFPMNTRARVSAVKGCDRTVREWEVLLRDEGNLSRSEAKVCAKALVNTLTEQRDVGEADIGPLVQSLQGLTSILKPS